MYAQKTHRSTAITCGGREWKTIASDGGMSGVASVMAWRKNGGSNLAAICKVLGKAHHVNPIWQHLPIACLIWFESRCSHVWVRAVPEPGREDHSVSRGDCGCDRVRPPGASGRRIAIRKWGPHSNQHAIAELCLQQPRSCPIAITREPLFTHPSPPSHASVAASAGARHEAEGGCGASSGSRRNAPAARS